MINALNGAPVLVIAHWELLETPNFLSWHLQRDFFVSKSQGFMFIGEIYLVFIGSFPVFSTCRRTSGVQPSEQTQDIRGLWIRR